MIEGLPPYISPAFIGTTFLTVGFLFYAVRKAGLDSLGAKVVVFAVPFWMLFQAALGLGGFFQVTSSLPPRIFAFAAFPGLLFAVMLVVFFRHSLIDPLPLTILTLLHVVRIPVEMVLFWLHRAGQVPEAMTFEGSNFDILSGITGPIVLFLAFRRGRVRRGFLIAWNIAALLLLVNIVTIAVLAFPSPMQQLAFEQPNHGVMYFPYNWLPAIVVPIVFFAHLASLVKLVKPFAETRG